VRPVVEPSLVSKFTGAKLPAIPKVLTTSLHLLKALSTASRHELFTRPATPDADTVTKAVSLLLKPTSEDRGENAVIALENEVPSLKVTASEPAAVAPVWPDNILLPYDKLIEVTDALVAFT